MNTETTSPILLLANPTEWMDRFGGHPGVTSPVRVEIRDDGYVRLIDIAGGVGPDWIDPARATGSVDHIEISAEDWERVKGTIVSTGAPAALLALSEDMANLSDDWEAFDSALRDDRFEAAAWFERGRKNLILTDNLTGEDILTLWDQEVDDAIEDGFLTPPRMIRPRSADWVGPLKEMALSKGLLSTSTIRLDRSKMKIPQTEVQHATEEP